MLALTLPPAVAALPTVRSAAHAWAAERGVSPFPLALVAVELVANAVDASPPGGPIEFVVDEAPSGIEVRVVDRGPGFDVEGPELPWMSLPPPSQERGRGLYLVNHLARDFRVDRSDGCTVVTAVLDPCPEPAAVEGSDRPGTADPPGQRRVAGPSAGA